MPKPNLKAVKPLDPEISCLVSYNWILSLYNISKITLHRMMDGKGYIEKATGTEYYMLKDVVRGIREYDKANGTKRGVGTKDATTARVNDARAVQIETENAVRAKQLMQSDERDAQFTIVFGAFSVELDTLSAQVTKDLEMRRVIDARVSEMKTRLLEKWKKLLVGKGDPADEEEPEEEETV